MYDPETSRLIRSAPALEGLDRERLPEQLTEAFAEIALARFQLRSGEDRTPERLAKLVMRMRRLAFTNEALIAVSPERGDRAAAAFVGGSAHVLSANALAIRGEHKRPYLAAESISSEIAAMLLFLVAESTADAAELAARVAPNPDTTIEQALLLALINLAKGDLGAILRPALPGGDVISGASAAETASNALYFKLLEGVRTLADELLRSAPSEIDTALDRFRWVQSLSSSAASDDTVADHDWIDKEIGGFSGPHHLASLLIAVAGDLAGSAVVSIPPPDGVDGQRWGDFLQRIAKTRPYLWRNHREAVQRGYLEAGTSSAIGFPTGAGKSTLSELKIGATLLAGRKVAFLAPTNALVDQTTRALRRSFPKAKVDRERLEETGFADAGADLPDIFVMTPEACLTQMSVTPDVFADFGLLVFDECHLLHSGDSERDRRALDAMLCVLTFAHQAPLSDLILLSAMMKNTDEIASWLEVLTGRPCLALALSWKPTRQLRGSVVYELADVQRLTADLTKSKRSAKTKAPSVTDKAALKIKPFGFFGLKQTWATRQTEDYALLPLLSHEVKLAASAHWTLTPNAGVVSADIVSAAARAGVKTLAFFQTIQNASKAKDRVREALAPTSIPLRDDEQAWLAIAVEELGGVDHIYLDVEGKHLNAASVVHHGLLLPEERQICESVFQRADGAMVMAATSTVAQGMNFPSELVVIAEDSRFDEVTSRREVLEAQELLNAAGRAGRAGQSANGIVLVVPGKVIGIDLKKGAIGPHWSSLQSIFGQSDQCLDIDDPLTMILDRVHAQSDDVGDIERYVVSRLASAGEGATASDRLLYTIARSLSGLRAARRNKADWIETRSAAARRLYDEQGEESEQEGAEVQIAATLGIPLEAVMRLVKALDQQPADALSTTAEWRKWFFDWLDLNGDLFDLLFRRDSLNDLLGAKFQEIESPRERAAAALPMLHELTRLWMRGHPLVDLERALGTKETNLKTCNGARKFVVRIVPEMAYLFSLPALVWQRRIADGESELIPPSLSQLGRCLRRGLIGHTQAAFSQQTGRGFSRRNIHRQYALVEPFLRQEPSDTWEETLARVERAIEDELNSRQG